MIKVIGWTALPEPLGASDPLAAFHAEGAPIAGVTEAGPLGTIVSEVLARTRGDLEATAFAEQWWPDEATFRTWWSAQPARASRPWFLTVEHVMRQPEVGAGQLKILGSAYKLDSFTTEAFFAYWRDVHGPLSAKAPGLRGYVVSEVTRRLSGSVEADGFVEQWWPDQPTLDAANASPEVAVAWADVANYAATTGTFWLVREHVLRAPAFPRGSLEDG